MLIGMLASHRVLLPHKPEAMAPVVVSTPGNGPAAPTEIEWTQDIEGAFARAEEEGKRVLMDFRFDGCPSCDEMDREAFPRPDIIAAASGFVPLRVDMTDVSEEEHALEEKYQVVGMPHLVIADADREEIASVTGYDDGPEGVLAFLEANTEGEGVDGPDPAGGT